MSDRFKALGGVVVVAALILAANVGTASATTANFISSGYPATLTGDAVEVANFSQEMFCSPNLSGELASKATSVSLTPKYEGLFSCLLGEAPATVAMEGCTYTFIAGVLGSGEEAAKGSRQIVCPSGKEIKITAGECVVKIPPMPEPVGPVHYKNLGTAEDGYIEARYEGPLAYWQNSKCGGTEGLHSATLKGVYLIENTYKWVWVG